MEGHQDMESIFQKLNALNSSPFTNDLFSQFSSIPCFKNEQKNFQKEKTKDHLKNH